MLQVLRLWRRLPQTSPQYLWEQHLLANLRAWMLLQVLRLGSTERILLHNVHPIEVCAES